MNQPPDAHAAYLASLANSCELPVRPGDIPTRNIADLSYPRRGRLIFDCVARENGANTREMLPVIDDGTLVDLLNVSALDPSSPTLVTLAFDVVSPGFDFFSPSELWPAATDMVIYVDIRWGAGKGQNRALLDLKQGTRVTLEASTIIASVRYQGIVSVPTRVSVSGTYDTAGSCINTCTLGPFVVAAETTSPAILIPPYARGVTVLTNVSPFTVLRSAHELLYLRQNTTTAAPAQRLAIFGYNDLPTGNGVPFQRYTLPNGIRAIAFTNGDAESEVEFTVIFDLAL